LETFEKKTGKQNSLLLTQPYTHRSVQPCQRPKHHCGERVPLTVATVTIITPEAAVVDPPFYLFVLANSAKA
jgi:hypothetical protein